MYLFAFFLLITSSLLAQQRVTIRGNVSDEMGPLPGASVNVKGQNGVITNVDGNYTITCPAGSVLIFSLINYTTQEIKVGNTDQSGIDVLMREISQQLDEVVVIGYGTMKKRDLTGAITSVSGEELQNNRPTNLAQALQGKIAGMQILSSSEPGAGSSISIRGASTLTMEGNEPLYIVDGMEVTDISAINPRDIASVEVLKDAASASIYGSKSANGVILITTVQSRGDKPTVSVNYSMKYAQISKTLPQMNREQGIDYTILRSFFANPSYMSSAIRDSLNVSYSGDNFYQDIMFRKSWSHQVDASIAGGSNTVKYYLSAGYNKEEGIQINTFNRLMTTRGNVDYQVTPKVKIGSRFSVSYTNRRQGNSETRNRILNRPAEYLVYNPDGSYTGVLSSRQNPLANAMLAPINGKNYNTSLNNYIEIKLLPELTLRSTISAYITQENETYFSPAVLNRDFIRSSYDVASTYYGWTQEDMLTFNKWFKKHHHINALAGFSLQQKGSRQLRLSVSQNITDAIKMSNAYGAVNLNDTRATASPYAMASFFGRVGYNYRSRYILNANLRYDGSSRFGKDKRWGAFPSASVGWRLSDEPFMKFARSVLTDSKIRISYGVTGNQSAGNFASYGLYATNVYTDNPGIYPSQLENRSLGWETTKQFNMGLDLSFLNNRLNIVADYYRKQTSDVLYWVQLPQTSGFSGAYRNIGNVDNKGFEITLNSVNISNRKFRWTTNLNLAFNENEITSVPEGGRILNNNVYIIDKGYALGTMYGYKARQIFAYDESNAFTPDWTQLTPVFDNKDRFVEYQLHGKTYTGEIRQLRYSHENGAVFKGGDVMWDDKNGDGVINDDDKQVIGNGTPKVVGGFTNDFTYKNFTLSFFFNFSFGGDVYMIGEANRNQHMWSAADRANPVNLANSWLAPGDIAKYPKPHNTGVENTRLTSSLWIEDGSYIRLKNIRLAYTFPRKVARSLRVEKADVYVMIQNFYTWSNYPGFDPEIPNRGYAIGMDNINYPKSKDILMGFHLTF